ncbi:PHD-finger domain-containing protein [Ophiocordyceps sinensis CO18]|uniref:PHD-finger domain-containing protein n=1 Tax=Ophiocordyceps sinensis (strain Co18 / CGMCC 3.14243) TaxID=911162 RepID=T5AFK2_OPHSC|nr:PHD-finger domain-containing protein [Ophiocordyceps sinensis CO18]
MTTPSSADGARHRGKRARSPSDFLTLSDFLAPSSSPPVPLNAEDNDIVEDAAPSQPRPAYQPQFSASSPWILERLRRDKNVVGPDSSNGPSPSVSAVSFSGSNPEMPSTQTVSSTLALPRMRPQPLASVSDVAKQSILFHPPSLKRKRSSDDAEADLPAKTPQMATSSPHFKEAPEASSTHRCPKCGPGSLPEGDEDLVTCISCQSSWHLQCVSAMTDVADSADFLCLDCKMGSGNAKAHQRRQLVERIRSKRLSQLPVGVVPAKPKLVGFYAKQASNAEVGGWLSSCCENGLPSIQRTEYFDRKKRTDLLNILSFCDQLKPQLLADVLVSVSRKHPELPIFDDPDWKANLPGRAAHPKSNSTSQSVRMSGQPRHGLALLNAKESRRPQGRPRLTKQTAVAEAEGAQAEIAVGYGGDLSHPPTWPKAGQGLYAQLPPEDEDREFLVDDNDEEAFSHFMVDAVGKPMAVSACA